MSLKTNNSHPIQLTELTKRKSPLIMGILNVTPDSFSDGGRYLKPDQAAEHARQMIADGAKIIDIGGESTRPGAQSVPPAQQIQRVVPVIQAISEKCDIPISIDTTSSEVARAALDAGAAIINDISALREDEQMTQLAAERQVPVILMHMRGNPQTMQQNPTYENVLDEVRDFLRERIEFARQRGVRREQIAIDPGIGFGKTVEHNLQLMKHLAELQQLGVNVLVGASRKSFIGKVLGIDNPADRIFGTAVTVVQCVRAGVQIIRVHDVKEMAQVVKMTQAIENS